MKWNETESEVVMKPELITRNRNQPGRAEKQGA
jgi:hypothetical protein